MVRLGIDASQRITSCAVMIGNRIAAALTMDKPIENYTVLIRNTLRKAQMNLDDLDEIVACIGPGSQMGVRATVVTGNTLGLALNIPVTGVLSTDALAVAAPIYCRHRVAVSAGKRRWYTAVYDWEDSRLIRKCKISLQDEIPNDEIPLLRSDTYDYDKAMLCARGVLEVMDTQSHLITQLHQSEVLPFDQAGFPIS